jgi:hypothetical protein
MVPKVVDGIAPFEKIGKCLKRYALALEHLGEWPHANRLAVGFSLVLEVESMKAAQAIWMEVLGEAISGGLEATDLIYRINRPTHFSRGPMVNKLITYQTNLISLMKIPQTLSEAAFNAAPEASGIVCRVDFDINTDANTPLNFDSRSQVKMIGKLIKTALSDFEIR